MCKVTNDKNDDIMSFITAVYLIFLIFSATISGAFVIRYSINVYLAIFKNIMNIVDSLMWFGLFSACFIVCIVLLIILIRSIKEVD